MLEYLTLSNISAVVGILGFIFTFLFHKWSRAKKSIHYFYEKVRLLGKGETALPEEVRIYYDRHEISELSKLNIIVWNSGNTLIEDRDVADGYPLEARLEGKFQILKPSIIAYSHPSNKTNIEIDLSDYEAVVMRFDYLEPKQGFNLEILYTGSIESVKMNGIIKGMPKGLQRSKDKEGSGDVQFVHFSVVGAIAVLVMTLVYVFQRTYINDIMSGSSSISLIPPITTSRVLFSALLAAVVSAVVPVLSFKVVSFYRKRSPSIPPSDLIT